MPIYIPSKSILDVCHTAQKVLATKQGVSNEQAESMASCSSRSIGSSSSCSDAAAMEGGAVTLAVRYQRCYMVQRSSLICYRKLTFQQLLCVNNRTSLFNAFFSITNYFFRYNLECSHEVVPQYYIYFAATGMLG